MIEDKVTSVSGHYGIDKHIWNLKECCVQKQEVTYGVG